MCRVPERSATYCTRERVSTSFHSKKVKLVFSNNGKDHVFLVTGWVSVDGGGRGVQPGASRLWDPQGRPPFLEQDFKVPPTPDFSALNSSGGSTYPTSSHQPEKGRMSAETSQETFKPRGLRREGSARSGGTRCCPAASSRHTKPSSHAWVWPGLASLSQRTFPSWIAAVQSAPLPQQGASSRAQCRRKALGARARQGGPPRSAAQKRRSCLSYLGK